MRWLPSRAHDSGLFLIFRNGVGVDDDEIRTGNAMILDPYGRILAETGKAEDAIVTADLDASLLKDATGRHWQLNEENRFTPTDFFAGAKFFADGGGLASAHLPARFV